jgi:hypothetical protein
VNDVLREEQNLHKVQVNLLKTRTVLDWVWNAACGSRYGPQTSPLVTVLYTRCDAPRHFWSALTAHHNTWNQTHILKKNWTPTSWTLNKNAIKNFLGYHWRPEFSTICRRRHVWFCRNALLVCGNYRRHSCISHCSFIFSVFVINTTQHPDNTTRQSVDRIRRYSCTGAKIRRFCGVCWRRRRRRGRLSLLPFIDMSATVES